MDTITKTNKLSKEQTRDRIRNFTHSYQPSSVIDKVATGLLDSKMHQPIEQNSEELRALTLEEFSNGILLVYSVPDMYRTFVIDLSRHIQSEYSCTKASEKSLAETISVDYVRILDIQRRMNNYLSKDSVSDIGVQFLNVMSKELDRASRHYLATLQTLHMLKQPPLNITVKASMANIANSQLIQQNNVVKPI